MSLRPGDRTLLAALASPETTVAELVAATGIAPPDVRYWLKRTGTSYLRRRAGRPRVLDPDKARLMRAAGMSNAQIAREIGVSLIGKHFGVSPQCIHQILSAR